MPARQSDCLYVNLGPLVAVQSYLDIQPSQEHQFPLTDLSPTEEHKSLELFDGVLSRNLGLDIVVVLTKTDCMTSLEAEHGLSDQHFDFIQQSIRWNF